ncbi:hypothetical protein Tco_1086611 [Tanacetum coccineum]
MSKAKQNKRKSIFKQAVEQKFKVYDHKPEALTSINVPEAIEEAVQAKILTEMNKRLPTYMPTASAKFVKPCLNNTVLERKSFESHDTHHKLSDLLYESICIDQESLDAQYTEPSFKKRPHIHQDPPNDREEEKRKKRRKDASESSSRSSKKDKAPMDSIQEYIPAEQPQDQEEELI